MYWVPLISLAKYTQHAFDEWTELGDPVLVCHSLRMATMVEAHKGYMTWNLTAKSEAQASL